MKLHFASCAVWSTNQAALCTCSGMAPWRIRKHRDELFPWQIYRRGEPGRYEPLMRCSSFEGARQLVLSLMWLAENGVKRERV